ncbi:hypothetical protein ACIRQP_40470, partial [Streptomyces sp. NPDC102274]|uniref:hypothetical protein n=1 Tax=Streptomyces sp. NPDC102274 TaxID=3366151 RepID=UPI003804E064
SSNGSSRQRERGPIRKAGPHNQRLYATRGLTLRDINRRLDVGMEAETERVYDMIMSRTA